MRPQFGLLDDILKVAHDLAGVAVLTMVHNDMMVRWVVRYRICV